MDRTKYPANWRELSELVRWLANDRCEWCGVPNRALGVRAQSGRFYQWHECAEGKPHERGDDFDPDVAAIKIVLTVMHVDHDTTNSAPENLRAACQRCHLRWDRWEHAANAARTRDRKRGQLRLIP